MAVLSNTMMQGTAAISDAEAAYKIEKSFRNCCDPNPATTYLKTITPNGAKADPYRWTRSIWVKMGRDKSTALNSGGVATWIWSWGDNVGELGGIGITTDGKIEVIHHNSSAYEFQYQPYWFPTDNAGWYHLVVAVDTAAKNTINRVRVFINGRPVQQAAGFPSAGAAMSMISQTHPSQFDNTNDGTPDGLNWIGSSWQGGNHFDGLLADPVYISGLTLGAASFGTRDSTGLWIPTAPRKPTPNNGTTWSSQTWKFVSDDSAVTWAGPGPLSLTFKGYVDGDNTYPASYNDFYWEPSVNLPLTTSLEIWCNYSYTGDKPIEVHTDAGVAYTTPYSSGWASNSWNGSHAEVICNVPYGSTKLTKLVIPQSSFDLNAIIVDGVHLQDGVVDEDLDTWMTNQRKFNYGVIRSDEMTVEGGTYHGNSPAIHAFDGNLYNNRVCEGDGTGEWIRWTPVTPVPFTSKVELWLSNVSGGSDCSLKRVGVGSTDDQTFSSGSQTWHTLYSGSGSIEYINIDPDSSNYGSLGGIRVDGVILTDFNTAGSSFHYRFNDKHNVGKDYLSGKLSLATGGLPILATTDDYGEVKGSGTASDPDAANLLLAVPFDTDTPTDYHATIKGSGTNRTFSTTSQLTKYRACEDARFYGSSADMRKDAKNKAQGVESSSNIDDFELGTGDFTVEWWAKWENNGVVDAPNANSYIFSIEKSDSGSPYPLYIIMRSNGKIGIWTNDMDISIGEEVKPNRWCHYAIVRHTSGTKWTLYINGRTITTHTASDYTIPSNCDKLQIGAHNGNYTVQAKLQDVRFYSKAKYTGDFTVPHKNDAHTVAATGIVRTIDRTVPVGTTVTIAGWHADHSYKLKDGNIFTVADGFNNSEKGIFTFSPAIPNVTKVRMKSQPYKHYLNGSDVSSTAGTSSGDPGWYTLYDDASTPINLTSCGNAYTNETQSVDCYAVEVNGEILTWDSERDTQIFNDTPTNSEPAGGDTGKGGEVSGKYAVWNQLLESNVTHDSGDRQFKRACTFHTDVGASGSGGAVSTIATPKTGKWYVELTFQPSEATNWWSGTQGGVWTGNEYLGIVPVDEWNKENRPDVYRVKDAHGMKCNTTKATDVRGDGGGSSSTTDLANGTQWTVDDTIGIAIDCDTPSLKFYKNGTAIGTYSYTIPSGKEWLIYSSDWHSYAGPIAFHINAGQFKFRFGAPSGYKSLCTNNFPDLFDGANINDPRKFFDVFTYRGDGSTRTFKGFRFSPDVVWTKARTAATGHTIYDTVRGVKKKIHPNAEAAEGTENDGLTAFNSDGWDQGNVPEENADTKQIVSWVWDCGDANATASTEGSITPSTQRVNNAAGFSITGYTGTGSAGTVGHGLSVKPDFYVIKNRSTGSTHWLAYTDKIDGSLDYFFLDDTDTKADSSLSLHTNTVFSVSTSASTGASGDDYVCYSWAGVPGFSSFGTYEGTSDNDGPFYYCGFKPALVLLKSADSTEHWHMYDYRRTINGADIYYLFANTMDGGYGLEGGGGHKRLNLYSNGFKIKQSDDSYNDDGKTYLVAAWAEHPIKTSRGW